MKPLIVYRSGDKLLLAQFSTEKDVQKEVKHLKEVGWEVLGIIRLKTGISVQNIESENNTVASK